MSIPESAGPERTENRETPGESLRPAGRERLKLVPADSERARDERELELDEWRESLDAVLQIEGKARAEEILQELSRHARRWGIDPREAVSSSFVNTIPLDEEPDYPGDPDLERKIENLVRWNAIAMVARGNRREKGLGGHISTYASISTLYEVGYNHFFRGKDDDSGGDMIYFQGHASPGNYARAFLEGRLGAHQLDAFRRELSETEGLSSYPHAWLMPEFWEYPTVSMGLGPLQAIYRARFERYLQNRGLKPRNDAKVWTFVGDGEFDEPETVGALTLAAREKLDHLIFVMNCNLQRLDGPVRSGGKIMQEMEGVFRGAGWEVIKLVWGSGWDRILERDLAGELTRRLTDLPDNVFQRARVEGGAFVRSEIFGASHSLRALVEDFSDDELGALVPGGHDPAKIYAAYERAFNNGTGRPVAILAQTVKGFGLGEGGEARNMTHKAKELTAPQARAFRERFGMDPDEWPELADERIEEAAFIRPPEERPEMRYLLERRRALGGFVPERRARPFELELPPPAPLSEFLGDARPRAGSEHTEREDPLSDLYAEVKRPLSTTHLMVRMLSRLARHEGIGRYVVPIVPDEARTFGIDALFASLKIHSAEEPQYPPVDAGMLISYIESPKGQILEEGITEAGAMASFIAAGTSLESHGVPAVPFYFFYSMFGFQRIGDLIWAAGDARARGFLLGCTAGRTTLSGEGLQHQDGQSHLFSLAYPNIRAYDPCFGYELATIIADGLRRMYGRNLDEIHYVTLTNEDYTHPGMPREDAGAPAQPGGLPVSEGIIRGMYLLKDSPNDERRSVDLLGSGPILRESLRAKGLLENEFDIGARVWSVTSYKELWRDAEAAARSNRLHPDEKERRPYVLECLRGGPKTIVAASDYSKAWPGVLGRWLGAKLTVLGTDGFGRSDSRSELRRYFEVNAEQIAFAALASLYRQDRIPRSLLIEARQRLGIASEKTDPMFG